MSAILEEMDLSERIKSLKGKKIKIKRLVRKDDGSYSLKESFVNLESEKSSDGIELASTPRKHVENEALRDSLQAARLDNSLSGKKPVGLFGKEDFYLSALNFSKGGKVGAGSSGLFALGKSKTVVSAGKEQVMRPCNEYFAQPRFRSSDKASPQSVGLASLGSDLKYSVFYEKLVASKRSGGDRMFSSTTSMRQSMTVSKAIEMEEEEALRLPAGVLRIVEDLESRRKQLEDQRESELKELSVYFDEIRRGVLAKVAELESDLCRRVREHYRRGLENLEEFSKLFSSFKQEETEFIMGVRTKAATICKSIRIVEDGPAATLHKSEPVNALMLICRLGVESKKRLLSFVNDKWTVFGEVQPVLGSSEAAREMARQEVEELIEKFGAQSEKIRELFKFREIPEVKRLRAHIDLEPLLTPSKNSLIHGLKPTLANLSLISSSQGMSAVSTNDKLELFAVSDTSVYRYSFLRKTFESLGQVESVGPVLLGVMNSFPSLLWSEAPRPSANSQLKREFFVVAGQKAVAVFDSATFSTVKKYKNLGEPRQLLLLKDNFTFLVGFDSCLAFYSLAHPEPLVVYTLQAEPTALQLTNSLMLLHVALSSGELIVFQLTYQYSHRLGKTVFASVEQLTLVRTVGQLFSIAELSFRNGSLVALSSANELQLISTVTLEVQERLSLDSRFHTMRLIEDPILKQVLVLLFSNTRLAVYSLEQRAVVRELELDPDHAYLKMDAPVFASLGGVKLIFTGLNRATRSSEVLRVDLS